MTAKKDSKKQSTTVTSSPSDPKLNATKTPDYERSKQHEESFALLSTLKFADVVDHGEIPLEWKKHPTQSDETYSALEAGLNGVQGENILPSNSRPCVSSRGRVDVSVLADLIRNGHDGTSYHTSDSLVDISIKDSYDRLKAIDMWDDTIASKYNVKLVRPSHDAWGIKKIALIFCDDFLQTVYEMPWWHNESSMQTAVQDIMKCLNLTNAKHRIVRMILASMPHGITIPVHHDSGEWVKHTHRIHVPIITEPEKVLFRVGHNINSLERIPVEAGHVFEMNNQAKHAVSNHWDKYRVHLILDYVDETFNVNERIKLHPGEVLHQTRRSIDREFDKGKRKTPSFLIIGAQKAGTTSLYDYLNQHPLIVRARRRETHVR